MSANTTNASAEQRLKRPRHKPASSPTPLVLTLKTCRPGTCSFWSGTLPVEAGVPGSLDVSEAS